LPSILKESKAIQLAADIRRGDVKAFELFYRMEFNNLVHFVDSYVHSVELAEDLAQETLCAVWECRDRIDCNGNLRAYTYKIARNKTLNALNSKALFADTSRRLELNEDIMALEDASLNNLIESLELAQLIEDVWNSIPESARESFTLSRKEGKTNKEIAKIRGLSTKAIEYHIHISLNLFRKMLKDFFILLGIIGNLLYYI